MDRRDPLPDELRDWQLIKLTGWTFAEVDAAQARRCDWLLAMAAIEAKVAGEDTGRG